MRILSKTGRSLRQTQVDLNFMRSLRPHVGFDKGF